MKMFKLTKSWWLVVTVRLTDEEVAPREFLLTRSMKFDGTKPFFPFNWIIKEDEKNTIDNWKI